MAQTQEFSYPNTPISPPDPEMVQRVWNRVMARTDQGADIQAPAQPPSAALPVPLPTPELSPDTGCLDSCLGAESMSYAGTLREMLDEICFMGRFYRAMLRQTQGGAARQLRCLAEDQNRQLKQLGVVYFLLTGEQFVYSDHSISVPRGMSYALREMFLRERQRYCVYIQGAEKMQDACLAELLEEFGETARMHAEIIRHILEGL